jgi:hypothetical protein
MKHGHQPTRAEDYRPAGNQFSLRGMFILITATSVIMAILALVIKSPLHWLGALAVPLLCLVIIGVMELGRRLFPPKPHFPYYLPPLPKNVLQTAYFGEGESPFAPPANYFSDSPGYSPFAPPPASQTAAKKTLNESENKAKRGEAES